MSINSNISFSADTVAVDAAIGRIKTEVKTIDKEIKSKFNDIRYMWSYLNHLLTISLSMTQRMAKGTKLAAAAQTAATGIQIVQTQVAVAHMIQMGIGMGAMGNIPGALLVYAVAAAMEAQMIIMFSLEAEARRNG